MSTESEHEREMEQRNDEAMYYAARDADDLAKADAELATLRQKLATAQAGCAAMRDAIEAAIYDFDPDVAKGPPCGPEMAAKLRYALAGRPTGQSILDELSAARKVCEAIGPYLSAQTKKILNPARGDWNEFDTASKTLQEARAAYNAARKAST